MRILIISQYFWPESFKINDLVQQLNLRGHSITVITGKPNYPEGYINSDFKDNPSKYSKFLDSIKIIRVPMILFKFLSLTHPSIKYKLDKLLGNETYSCSKIISSGFKPQKTLRQINETNY